MLKKNGIYDVTIDGYSSEGMGVARIDGQVVFVHRAIKGERCRVQILKALKNIAYARILELIEPSAHRVQPDCPHFGRCGGCDLRHMDYTEELSFKRARVQDALTRIGGAQIEVEDILGASAVDAYRNKAVFPVDAGGKIGFYRARTHEVVEVENCRLQREESAQAANAVRLWMRECGVSGYDGRTGHGLVRHVYVRSNVQGESLVCVFINGTRTPKEQRLVSLVREYCPHTVGVLLGINTRQDNVILGEDYRVLWGRERLEDTLCGSEFSLSVPSFYQINHDQTERLYAKAVELAALTGGELAVDLYCGAGTITLALAAHAKHIIGVEIVGEAVRDARENAQRNGVENAEFCCGDASDIAARLAAQKLRPDVITVDPPRKGLTPEVIDAIAQMAPQRVVYVSCDPGTLGRDIARFKARGYAVTRAAAVDMFPRTVHVESCVRLERTEKLEEKEDTRT
ncbi:MAG: 23S rRNA (uracil(1939)-C(5))-methyltransferase RlmD [Oscillospiraceae bacterium]|nr:23S rRNA (uracil(1939)-C(5))-methyltransferase RlmD [Oscillospiraceae bacterium]